MNRHSQTRIQRRTASRIRVLHCLALHQLCACAKPKPMWQTLHCAERAASVSRWQLLSSLHVSESEVHRKATGCNSRRFELKNFLPRVSR